MKNFKHVICTIILLLFTALVIESCRKDAQMEIDNSTLLDSAMRWYNSQVALAASGKPDLNVKTLSPQWGRAVTIKPSTGGNIIGVPLFISDSIYIELNFSTANGKPYGILKKYNWVSKSIKLYTGSGNLYQEGIYDAATKSTSAMNTKEMFDARKTMNSETTTLNEVIIYGTPTVPAPPPGYYLGSFIPGPGYYPPFPTYPVSPPNGGIPGGGNFSNNIDIGMDTSIINSPKIVCLLDMLLGSNGNTSNPQFTALLQAFKNKGFDVTFKIGTTKPDSKGETSEDPYNATRYNIVLNRAKINTESKMSWVKTLLHEAFHANLLQKCYELYGSTTVGLWQIGPTPLTIEELMDKIFDFTSTNGSLSAQHHEYMAENFQVIRDGLKAFSLVNNPNHSDFTDEHFTALAYEGLNGTNYYLNKVVKDENGDARIGTYNGQTVTLTQAYYYKAKDLREQSVIPCN